MYEKNLILPKAAFDRVASLLSIFTECNKTTALKLNTIDCWHPLEHGFFKLNIDGAYFDHLQAVGLGAFVRDSNGDVVITVSMKENMAFPLETIECLAILRGL